MDDNIADLPDNIDALKAALTVARAKMREVTAGAAELAVARAKASLARIATYPAHRVDELLPRNWTPKASAMAAAAA